METIPTTDCAYLAGILDGEGFIGLAIRPYRPDDPSRHRYASWTAALSLSTTTPALCWWLLERFGGRLYAARSEAQQKPIFQWKAGGKAARQVLEAALPYLLLKRRQAELVLAFLDTAAHPGRRGTAPAVLAQRQALADELHRLNGRGVAYTDPEVLAYWQQVRRLDPGRRDPHAAREPALAALATGAGIREVAREYGISHTTLRRWRDNIP